MSTVNPWRLYEAVAVPLGLLAMRGLSPGAKLCLGLLFRYAGKNGRCYPAVPTLAAGLGVCDRQVQGYLSELEAAHIIKRDKEPGKTSQYHFVASVAWPVVQDTSPLVVQDTSPQWCSIVHPKRSTEGNHHQGKKKKKRESSFHPSSTVTLQQPTEQPKPISLSGDDDDRGTPFIRLGKWIARRHPEVDANEVTAFVKRDLEDHGLLLSETFLHFARKRATGRSTNPTGLYRRLVRDFIAKGRAEAIENQEALMRAIREGTREESTYQCSKCGSRTQGEGLLVSDGAITACTCASAEFVQRMQEENILPKTEATA